MFPALTSPLKLFAEVMVPVTLRLPPMYTLFEASLPTAPLPLGGFVVGPLNANVLKVDQKNIPTIMTPATSAIMWIFLNGEDWFILMAWWKWRKGAPVAWREWSLGSHPRPGLPSPRPHCSYSRAASRKQYFES